VQITREINTKLGQGVIVEYEWFISVSKHTN
jgi:hypothetical protein